ncbi:hypothetical protein DM01DRAFT_1405187 [Hesseltinella vesiculosa]|uniref:Uncharacterized protein n=1 Tax=Hesseltinella vesiculosa TaxID=101127 RepID=A0A1X2GRI0_9FUNG|nr:hypothetical protein DM01DRAFT_1405187 [Hesseltinella vesiculosa]
MKYICHQARFDRKILLPDNDTCILPLVRDGNHTLFTDICQASRLATTAVYSTPQMATINRVPFSDLRSPVEKLYPFCGYSYLNHPSNRFGDHQQLVLGVFLENPLIKQRITQPAGPWNKSYDEPARVEENPCFKCAITAANRITFYPRNLFWMNSALTLEPFHQRSRTNRHMDKFIARFLPRKVAELVTQYLALIHHSGYLLVNDCPRQSLVNSFGTHLFVNQHGKATSGLRRVSPDIAFARRKLGQGQVASMSSTTQIMDLQPGHSTNSQVRSMESPTPIHQSYALILWDSLTMFPSHDIVCLMTIAIEESGLIQPLFPLPRLTRRQWINVFTAARRRE